jgi:integrase
MQADIVHGTFDATLARYELPIQSLGEAAVPAMPQPLSLMQVAQEYAKAKKRSVEATTFRRGYEYGFLRMLERANSETPREIYSWMTENFAPITVFRFFSQLEKCINWAIKRDFGPYGQRNPFVGMAEEAKDILPKERLPKKGLNLPDDSDLEALSDTRAFMTNEREIIIAAFQNSRYSYLVPVILFLFLTGCRPGEAAELRWKDFSFDPKASTGKLYIRRAYAPSIDAVKPTKTREKRWFLVVDPRLVDLLLELKSGCEDTNALIFKHPDGNRINMDTLSKIWGAANYNGQPGIVVQLANERKIRTYLKFYACRHTFITLQLIALGMNSIIAIAKWVGNSPETIYKHYADPPTDLSPASV